MKKINLEDIHEVSGGYILETPWDYDPGTHIPAVLTHGVDVTGLYGY